MVSRFSPGAHPMGMMTALTGALAADTTTGSTSRRRRIGLPPRFASSPRLPLLAALTYRHPKGLPPPPRQDLGYAGHFLHATFAEDESYEVNPSSPAR